MKGGVVHGTTDEWGWNITQDRVHIHDLHATMLHLLGLDHERLTYRYGGRDYRLTDVHGQVVKAIMKEALAHGERRGPNAAANANISKPRQGRLQLPEIRAYRG